MKNVITFLLTVCACLAQTPDTSSLPLMPWPQSLSLQPGALEITNSFSISVSGTGGHDPRVQYQILRTFERLSRETAIPVLPHVIAADANPTLSIIVEQRDHRAPQKLGDNERYSLEVSSGHARISADGPLGVLRGIETFLQTVQQNQTATSGGPASPGFSVQNLTIHDEPRFPWRGLSLDVSRHFIPLEEVKRTLDGMAAVKLNVLHWHLSDDQGVRVESKKYPRLQKYGSDGMFYTQAEVRDVIGYARNRGIRIVPEFDMPGHATSWLAAYPKLGAGSGQYAITRGNGVLSDLIDPTKEYTYRFLDGFVGEMAALFPDEYFHIGGDEVDPKQWNANPEIQAFMRKHHLANSTQLHGYFNQRLLKIVSKHHKHMEGWDEILQPELPKNIVIQSWRGQQSLWQAARQGFQGILSAGYYLDLMYPASYHYSIDPMKAPGPAPNREEGGEKPPIAPGTPADLTPEQQKLILGGEAAMWEEIATAENLDAKLWPRLAAIAERLWSPEAVTDTVSMYRRLEMTNEWLEWLGLSQRSNLELMRQRLAGSEYKALDTFSSILEPVKGYSRHAENYNIFSPFNHLVDAIPPESDAARVFRDDVGQYLAGPKGSQASEELRKMLARWIEATASIRPVLQRESILNEDVPVADAVLTLCKAGQAAVDRLDGTTPGSADWKQRTRDAVKLASARQANMLIQIAPAIQKLVDAAPGQ